MADNYLENKMEEYRARTAPRKPAMTLGRLLARNRSCRGYDAGFIVREDQLRTLIEVNAAVPSARNQQVLRFRPVLADEALPWDAEALAEECKARGEAADLKPKLLFQPLRVAVCGNMVSPPLLESVVLMDRADVLARIDAVAAAAFGA